MRIHGLLLLAMAWVALSGCASMKESDTARTGTEQLLISSAVDKALDKVDLAPIAGAKVFVETKYLDCVDKNYVLVSLHQRLLHTGCTLVDSADEGDVILEVGSGGVGTDRSDLFFGIPEIPLPPPSPIAIPRMALFERKRAIGTAKLAVVAYDAKTRYPVINSGTSLARADYRNWNIMGSGNVLSGSLHDEIYAATGESESILKAPAMLARPTRSTVTR